MRIFLWDHKMKRMLHREEKSKIIASPRGEEIAATLRFFLWDHTMKRMLHREEKSEIIALPRGEEIAATLCGSFCEIKRWTGCFIERRNRKLQLHREEKNSQPLFAVLSVRSYDERDASSRGEIKNYSFSERRRIRSHSLRFFLWDHTMNRMLHREAKSKIIASPQGEEIAATLCGSFCEIIRWKGCFIERRNRQL